MQSIIQRILCGVSMHCMAQVLYEGQLTDHSHPRLPSQGRATRSHPHLGDVALVKKRRFFFQFNLFLGDVALVKKEEIFFKFNLF